MQQETIVPSWLSNSIGLALLLLLLITSINLGMNLRPKPQPMQVSATSSLSVVPDVATVSIGVVSEGAIQAEVQNQTIQKMNQVIQFLKQQHIERKDIETTGFYLSPQYQYNDGKNVLVGYHASQTITVQIKNIDRTTTTLATIVSGVTQNGANQIQGITFGISDVEKIEQTLRNRAIEKAKQKAQNIALQSSLKLGKIINVVLSESPEPIHPIYAMSTFARTTASSPNIEAGKQTVSETMTLIFEVF